MSVMELIDLLSEIENKNLPVYVWHDGELQGLITAVDSTLTDRIDLNY